MILPTLNFEYALQWQSTKTISFSETSNAFICAFVIRKPIFISHTIDKHKAEICTCFVRLFQYGGSHTTGATKRSIIANDEIEDRNGRELLSEYHKVH